MKATEFAARLEEMRKANHPRLTLRMLPHGFDLRSTTTPTGADVQAINAYLSAFMPPVYSTSSIPVVVCPCCNGHLFANHALADAMNSVFRGGLAAGEGYCGSCVYPLRIVHTLPAGRHFTFPLAYHPNMVRVHPDAPRSPREVAARLERRRDLARAKGGTKWLM